MSTRNFANRMSSVLAAVIAVALFWMLSTTALSQTQATGQKTSPPTKKAVTKKSAPTAPKPDVLNNQAVIKLVDAGLDEALICAKIKSAEKAEFQLDTDSIIELKNKKVPASVIRAMMEKSGMAVADVKPPEPQKPQPEPTRPAAALSGTWAGQMTVEGEPTAIRMVFQKSALGTYSGAIAFQSGSGAANSGRVELREQGAGMLLSAATDAGAQVEFTPASVSAGALSGEVQLKVAGANGIRRGTFNIAKESDREDLAELLRFQNSLGKVIARQGDTWQITLAPRPQQHAFSKSKAADAKDAAKDIALTQVGTTMAANIGARIATSGIPLGGYFAYPVAVLTMIPFLKRNPEIRGFEFEFLRDSKAVVEIKQGPVEFVLPLNQYIPSDANITDVQPVLIQLDVMGTDAVRIVTSRKVTMKTKKQKKFDTQPGVERTELSVEQKTIAADVEKGPNNSFILRPKAPLVPGEYAIGVFTKSPAGAYTENVPLKAQWSSDEMARFMKKGEEWTGYGALAWDFRVKDGAKADTNSATTDSQDNGTATKSGVPDQKEHGATAVTATAAERTNGGVTGKSSPEVAAKLQDDKAPVEREQDADVNTAGWKRKLKDDIESSWKVTRLATDRLRITDPGTVFVLKKDGITGDLASDGTFTQNTVEGGRILAPKGAVAFLQNKKTSRPFKAGEKVYLWKTNIGDDHVGLFFVSYDTFPVSERGGRTTQTRYKAYLAFKFEKASLPRMSLSELKPMIAEVIASDAEAQAASTKTISLGQSTKEVEDLLGRPERIVNLGPKITYIYKDMKVIFQDGKVADVQ
ncbi:MAG TPA: hypothetical protein VFA33_05790 [Bryobacteraceae bacterium]|nr:hypothetical protein [Bryobacteraceae bacterium]